MERTIPAALLLSALLCVGAWVLGEPVLLIFGGDYSRQSWAILALLVPAGLWMVFKDHLVALWRSQRRFALATRLAGAALVIEIAGATTGGIIGGARGLCIGWLIAMGVEMALGAAVAAPGLRWPALAVPLPARRRTEAGRAAPQSSSGPRWSWPSAASGSGPPPAASRQRQRHLHGERAARARRAGARPASRAPSYRGPKIDLNVQSATGDPARPIRTYDEVRGLVELAKDAGAQVISTTASFRAMQPVEGGPIRFGCMDRTIAAARVGRARGAAAARRRCRDWALDEPAGTPRQPPRTDAELAAWADFVTRRDAARRRQGGLPRGLERAQRAEVLADRSRPGRVHPAARGDVRRGHAVSPDDPGDQRRPQRQRHRLPRADVRGRRTRSASRQPLRHARRAPVRRRPAPDEVDPAKRYERDPYGLFDENFTGFRGCTT